MAFHIIGTAGHIDHGKTELSKALTGIQTDRLKEEQDRGISIQLGFAPLTLKDDLKVGLIDVPGHEKFIKQMLAGVGGMDLILLVIAADEGIMPQTKEHLDIIKLLGIQNVIVVLTKKSLVDEEWLSLVKEDVKDYMTSRNYPDAKILAVDSLEGDGIEALKTAIENALEEIPERKKGNYTRLPIDRVFTLTGFGTIVTGTLWSGIINKGDNLILLPQNKKVKVRSIQVHGENKEKAEAGQRVALNIPDLGVKEIQKGSLLLGDNNLQPTYKLVAYFSLLEDKKTLKNRQKIRLYLGTTEVLGKIILLEGDTLEPGNSMFCAFYLEQPITCSKGDRIIIRTQTPMDTIGGATIVDVVGDKIRRNSKDYILSLEKKLAGSPEETLIDFLNDNPLLTVEEISQQLDQSKESMESLIESIKNQLQWVNNRYLTKETYTYYQQVTKQYIESYLEEYPLRNGLPKEDLRSKHFKIINSKTFNQLIDKFVEENWLEIQKDCICLKNFDVPLDAKTKEMLNQIIDIMKKDGFSTQNSEQLSTLLNIDKKLIHEYLNYWINKGQLIKISEDFYLENTEYHKSIDKIIDYLHKNGSIKLGEARDLLDSSRKFILPFLEHLDYKKITKRNNEERILF